MMPDEKLFIDTMKRLNIKLSDKVVCYDAGAMQLFGYRALWMLQTMGHKNCFVLDGGYQKWVAEGKPIEVSDDTVTAQDYDYKLEEHHLLHYEQIKEYEMNPNGQILLDGRAPDQFKAGHIKNSKNFPLPKIVSMDTKTMKPAD